MKSCDIKLYRGYANQKQLVVFGHVIENYPNSENQYTRKGFRYARTIVKLFSIKTIPNIRVTLKLENIVFTSLTEKDGYFRFIIDLPVAVPPGWNKYQVSLNETIEGQQFNITKEEEYFSPYESSYCVISDIDDTFLVSHSRKSIKKLFVLLSKNVQARKPFQDVVKHYQLLSYASRNHPQIKENIFFYVSSSEWNLYDMIIKFSELNGLPKAILKLKKIKSGLDDFIMTGKGNHDHKFNKIFNIIDFYPELQFILLGDDSQKDPEIYHQIGKRFPNKIKTVYIRQTRSRKKMDVVNILKEMQLLNIETCYFDHSNKAVIHSLDNGIVFQTPSELGL